MTVKREEWFELNIDDLKTLPNDLAVRVLRAMTYREREIIKLLYGLDDGFAYTHEEVARIFKVSPERIHYIQQKALRKLAEIAIDPIAATIKLPEVSGEQLVIDQESPDPSISLVIDPGSASSDDVANLLYEMSKLYRMVGGLGIRFDLTESREIAQCEVVA